MNATLLLLPCAAVLLGSCAHFEERPLEVEESSASFAGRSLHDPGLRAFLEEEQAAGRSWTIDQLALAAAYFHPDVALARAEAEESAAAILTAGQRPDPVFTFTPQWTNAAVAFTPWFFNPILSIPLETAGKRPLRTEQAMAAAEAARWRVSARAWTARSRVRAAMLDVYGARENIRLLETEEALHDESIRKLTAQMEAGDVSQFELTQARLMLNRTRLARQDAERLAATGEARLASAIGIPTMALRGIALDFSTFARLAPVNAAECRRFALSRRADLMSLLAEYAAAEARLKLELARQYPDINVNPGYDFNSGQNRWQLGLNLQVPLNQNRGPIAEAEARRITSEKRFLAQQGAIEGEVDIALAAYQASRSKSTTAAQLEREAAAATETTRRMVEGGEVSALELTRRRIEASTANVALLAANLEALTAAGALEDAMQAPLR
jgi:outer membrane protein, heavy metal efflux system